MLFKQFIEDDFDDFDAISFFENKKYMKASTRHMSYLPLPMEVLNVLNAVKIPGSNERQAHVLHWILTHGVLKAAVARKKWSKYWSEKLGFHIDEQALFSQAARDADPRLGQSAKDIDKAWFQSGSEPDVIQLTDMGRQGKERSAINLRDINAHLIQMGLKPMLFGGPNGLMEYIERGDWVRSDFHIDSPFGKQGFDLTVNYDVEDELPFKTIDSQDDEGGQSFYYQLGTSGYGGYVPPLNRDAYSRAIEISEMYSSQMLKKLATEVAKGNRPEELDKPELSFLNQLFQNGQVKSSNKKMLLKELVGLIRKERSGYAIASDLNHYTMAKAIAYNTIKELLKSPAQIKPNKEKGGTTSALGNNNNSSYRISPAVLTFSATEDSPVGRIDLADYDLTNESGIEKAATDIINKVFPDDSKRKILRGGFRSTRMLDSQAALLIKGDAKKNRHIINFNADQMIGGDFAKYHLEKQSGVPLPVVINGNMITVDKDEAIKVSKKGIQSDEKIIPFFNVSNKFPAKIADLTQEDLDRMYQDYGYMQIGQKEKEDEDINAVTFGLPGTFEFKRLIRQNGNMWKDVQIADPEPVDVNLKLSQGWTAKEFGDGQYMELKSPDEKKVEILKSSVVDAENGEKQVVWYLVANAIPTDVEPLLHNPDDPMRIPINWRPGQKVRYGYEGRKHNQIYNDFLDNWESWGEESPPFENRPSCLWDALKKIDREKRMSSENELKSAGDEVLSSLIGNVSFWYGDPIGQKDAWLYGLEKIGLNPDEAQLVLKQAYEAIHKKKQDPEGISGPELFQEPNKFRRDLIEFFVKMGWLWRRNKIWSAMRSVRFDAQSRGSGGDNDNEEQGDAPDYSDDDDNRKNRQGEYGSVQSGGLGSGTNRRRVDTDHVWQTVPSSKINTYDPNQIKKTYGVSPSAVQKPVVQKPTVQKPVSTAKPVDHRDAVMDLFSDDDDEYNAILNLLGP